MMIFLLLMKTKWDKNRQNRNELNMKMENRRGGKQITTHNKHPNYFELIIKWKTNNISDIHASVRLKEVNSSNAPSSQFQVNSTPAHTYIRAQTPFEPLKWNAYTYTTTFNYQPCITTYMFHLICMYVRVIQSPLVRDIHRICLFYSEIGQTHRFFLFFELQILNIERILREKNTIHGKKSKKKTKPLQIDLRENKFKSLKFEKRKCNMKYTTTHSPMCASLTANKKILL